MNQKEENKDWSAFISALKYVKVECFDNEYIATLVDTDQYEIIKGYGRSPIAAINDVHENLI